MGINKLQFFVFLFLLNIFENKTTRVQYDILRPNSNNIYKVVSNIRPTHYLDQTIYPLNNNEQIIVFPFLDILSKPSSNSVFDPTKHKNWKLVNSDKCGLNVEDRIIGGIKANLGQYPWIARVGYNMHNNKMITYLCGGVLISTSYVLTAAHCTTNLATWMKLKSVRLGEFDVKTEIDCVYGQCADKAKDYNIEKIIPNNKYDAVKKKNDIALLKLNDTVVYTKWIAPICLPFGNLMTKKLENSKVDVAGWGYYNIRIPVASTTLQTVKLPVVNADICEQKFRHYSFNTNSQLCVGGEVGKDSCNGDSGGPLMKVDMEGNDGPRYYLFGVVSYGAVSCGLTSSPAVYTKVVDYLNWILDNVNQ